MKLSIHLEDLKLVPIFSRNIGGALVKGGKKANPDIYDSCGRIKNRFLCYYWKSHDSILYVGSVSKDYKGKKNNLVGRIGNYLQNHIPGMTNKNVFDAANSLLGSAPLEFGLFAFTSLVINGKKIDFSECSEDGDLTYMIENLIIGFYKSSGQCTWNR